MPQIDRLRVVSSVLVWLLLVPALNVLGQTPQEGPIVYSAGPLSTAQAVRAAYLGALTDDAFVGATKEIVRAANLLSQEERRLSLVSLAESAKTMEPGSRYLLLRDVGLELADQTDRDIFRAMLLKELWQLVVLERFSPRFRSVYGENDEHALQAADLAYDTTSKAVRSLQIAGLSDAESTIHAFPGLVRALLDGCEKEQERFDTYWGIRRIAWCVPKDGEIDRYLQNPEIGLFPYVASKPFGKVLGPVLGTNGRVEEEWDKRRVLIDIQSFHDIKQRDDTILQRVAKVAGDVNDLRNMVSAHANLLTDYGKAIRQLQADVAQIKSYVGNHDAGWPERNAMIKKFAPVFKPHDNVSGPIMRPSEFADGCALAGANIYSPNGNVRWKPQELADWLLADPANVQRSFATEMAPITLRERIRDKTFDPSKMNADAKRNGWGIFAHCSQVPPLNQVYSVKYFLFLAQNRTSFPGGEGGHEGDWICVDLQVKREMNGETKLLFVIFHEHGRQKVVFPTALDLRGGIRPVVYLEHKTNEAHPSRRPANMLKAIHEVSGNGDEYDTQGHVRDLDDPKWKDDLDCILVRSFAGQWGEKGVDNFVDVTNPRGPRWQPKMWDRAFARNRSDPSQR